MILNIESNLQTNKYIIKYKFISLKLVSSFVVTLSSVHCWSHCSL